MNEVIHNNPFIFLGCFVWVPVGIWVLSMIAWVIQGDVDPLPGIGSVLTMVALGILSVKPPEQWMTPAIFGSLWAAVLFYPLIRTNLHHRAHCEIDLELLEGLYERIEKTPENMYTAIRMAEIVYERGLPGHAIGLVEKFIAPLPKTTFLQEHALLTKWLEDNKDPNVFRPVRCLKCKRMVAPGGFACPKCHSRYLLATLRMRLLGPSLVLRLLAAWVVGVIAVIGIPVVAHSPIPQWESISLIVGMIAIGVLVLGRAFWRHTLEDAG